MDERWFRWEIVDMALCATANVCGTKQAMR